MFCYDSKHVACLIFNMQRLLVYSDCHCSVGKLAKEICEQHVDSGLETLRCHHTDGSYTVLFRSKHHSLLRWIAMDQSVSIKLWSENRTFRILIDSGAWHSKCLLFALSLFLFWPLGLCAAAGALLQLILSIRTLHTVQQCIKRVGGVPV